MQKSCWILAAGSLVLAMPADAASPGSDALDLHLFEAAYARPDAVHLGVDRIRAALPLGSDLTDAAAVLHRAGAHCSATRVRSGLACWYREPVSFDDVGATEATWSIAVSGDQGRVTRVEVDHVVERH